MLAVCQFKPRRGARNSNLAALTKIAVEALEAGTRLIVLPEMAATGYRFPNPEAIRPMAEPPRGPTFRAFSPLAKQFKAHIVVGFVEDFEGRLFNAALVINPEGRIEAQLSRETLHRCLRRYQIEVPNAWTGVAALEDAVIRRSGSRRELGWTIWGEEAEVAERLRGAGATLRHIDALTLADAAHALLARHAVADPPEVMQPRETVSAGA